MRCRTRRLGTIAADVLVIGDLVYLQVLGRSILLISDIRVASDILDKRSATNSSRPASTAAEM